MFLFLCDMSLHVACFCMLHVFAYHCKIPLHVFACFCMSLCFFISSSVKVRMRQDDFSGRSFHFGHVELFGNIKVYIGIYLCI